MEVSDYCSIFELFCVFYLGYVISGDIFDKNYLVLIIDKILRGYSNVHDDFKKLEGKIQGRETSLNQIAEKIDSAQVQEYNKIKSQLVSYRHQISQSKKEIFSIMAEAYKTNVLVYINLYLSMFCILMLFVAGMYKIKRYNEQLDSALSIVLGLTLVILIFCWIRDNTKRYRKKKHSRKNSGIISAEVVNGYRLIFTIFIIVNCIGVFFFFFVPVQLVNSNTFEYRIFHNVLVCFSVLIPLSNFIVYFIKAKLRAKLNRNELELKSNLLLEQSDEELKVVDAYISSLALKEYNMIIA